MKSDLYTKGILTVIAVALMVVAFKDFPPEVSASDCATSWQISSIEGKLSNIERTLSNINGVTHYAMANHNMANSNFNMIVEVHKILEEINRKIAYNY